MPRRTVEIVVPVWRHGREAVATCRSLQQAISRVGDGHAIDVVVAVSPACAAQLPDVGRFGIGVRHGRSDTPGELVLEALRASQADVFGMLEAGDLIDDGFLAGALNLDDLVIARPATVVTFGSRTGTWTQPEWSGGGPGTEDSALTRLLARVDVWAPTFVAPRNLALEAVSGVDLRESALAWSTAFLAARIPQRIVPGSSTYLRRWSPDAARVRSAPVLRPLPLLGGLPEARSSALPMPPLSRRVPAPLRRYARAGARVAQPWRELARGRRSATRRDRFEPHLLGQWRAANHLEALVPFPRPDVAGWVEDWDSPPPQTKRELAAYWWILSQLPAALDYLFFAPWLRTGGGDSVLLQYIEAVLRAEPLARVALLTTEPVRSTRLAELTGRATTIELADVLERGVSRDALVQWIVPQIIAQVRPRTVHAVNSTVAFDVIERFGADLAADTAIFLSTFAIDRSDDGEKLSVMYLRRPGFLDPVESVLVDSERYVDRLVDELGYAREKFAVQRSVVNISRRTRLHPAGVGVARPLRVLWAGRFDLPKRLDVLAAIAVQVRARALPIEIHFYGLEVMGSPELAETLRTLESAGAVRHPPYSRFSDLPLDDVDAYLLTSEWEGIPLSMLEAMAAGIPVIAPLVGGVGEVLDDSVGYPVARFDDIDGYLGAFQSIISDERSALDRADRARRRIVTEFSAEAFDRRLHAQKRYLVPGHGSR